MIRFLVWRMHRRGLVGFGAAGLLLGVFYGAAFIQAAGTTAASQAAFGRSLSLVGSQFAFLVPPPVHPETMGGYEQYKSLSGLVIVLMLWAALAGVAAGRGDEDRGLTEQWLAAGVSKARLLLSRSAAFGLVLLAVCVASVLGIAAVAPAAHQDPNLGGEVGKAVSMAAGLVAGYGVALLVSQLPAERQTATAFGVGAVVLLLVINGLADTVGSLSSIGAVSPFHWMEKTTSAAPGGTFDPYATLGLLVAAAVLVGASIAVSAKRDAGRGLFTWSRRRAPAAREASRNPMLRTPFTEGLWEQRVGLGVWAAGTMLLAAVMVAVTKSVADAITSAPGLAALFRRAEPGPEYAAFLGFVWFGFALLLLAGYAVVQVSRWSGQDQEGRVELLLSAPVSRARLVVERAVEFSVASLLIVAGGYAGVALRAPGSGLRLDPGHVFTASALLWPFALAFGGLGVAVASRWPRIAVPFLAAFAVVEYFLGDLAPLFKLPSWTANLSVFHLYGNPAAGGASWTPAVSMVLVFLAGFAAALVLVRGRDVSSSA